MRRKRKWRSQSRRRRREEEEKRRRTEKKRRMRRKEDRKKKNNEEEDEKKILTSHLKHSSLATLLWRQAQAWVLARHRMLVVLPVPGGPWKEEQTKWFQEGFPMTWNHHTLGQIFFCYVALTSTKIWKLGRSVDFSLALLPYVPWEQLSFPIFFLKFLNGENSGGMPGNTDIYKCFLKPLNTNFSKFPAQIWHEKNKVISRPCFFPIWRSVGRGHHNNFFFDFIQVLTKKHFIEYKGMKHLKWFVVPTILNRAYHMVTYFWFSLGCLAHFSGLLYNFPNSLRSMNCLNWVSLLLLSSQS